MYILSYLILSYIILNYSILYYIILYYIILYYIILYMLYIYIYYVYIYIYHFVSLPSDPVPRLGTDPRRMRMPSDHWRLRAGWRRFFWGMSEKPSGFIWKFRGTPHEHTGFRRSCSFQKKHFRGITPFSDTFIKFKSHKGGDVKSIKKC